MAILTVQQMATVLGLDFATLTGPQVQVITNSINGAQALVEAYLNIPLEPAEQVYEGMDLPFNRYLYLPHRPIISVELMQKDEADFTDYKLGKREGVVVFGSGCWSRPGPDCGCPPWAETLRVEYTSGWEDLPPDLLNALQNITSGVYSLGGDLGSLSSGGGTGALKSMTMFDAMSMSFDVGDGGSSASGPEEILSAWGFVLNKYRNIELAWA